jgi:putative transposase
MIERFLKTFNENVSHGIPGTTFRNILEKDDYDPSKFAVVRWSTLKKISQIWVVDVYHQKIHRSLGVPPALKWASSIRQEDIPLPDDPKSLNFIFGKCEERTLSHKGIELHGLFYNSVELTYLRRRLGDSLRVEVRVDTSDLGRIVVLAPDKAEMYDVPCLRIDYAASLSLYQHRICRRFANRYLGNYSPEGWLEAKSQIRKIVEEEIFHKKRRTRSKAARFRNMDATESTTAQNIPQTPALPASSSDATADDFDSSLQDEVASTPDTHQTSASAAPPRRITPRYRDRGPSE